MFYSINSYLIRLAEIILSATLTKEELKQMIDHLDKMVDKGYFISKEHPLTLQPDHHLSTNFFGYNFNGLKTMSEIMDRLALLIKTTGKAGNKDMRFLSESLERAPEWNINFKDLDFQTAKHKAHRAFEFLNELIHKIPSGEEKDPHVSPEELQEMKRLHVLK